MTTPGRRARFIVADLLLIAILVGFLWLLWVGLFGAA